MPPSTSPKRPAQGDVDHVEVAVPDADIAASATESISLPFRGSALSHNWPETGDLTASRPARRFAPQPVEQTSRSSKDRDGTPEPKRARKFAPEPVEHTSRSSKDAQEKDKAEKPKVRKFAPEPVEHTHISSKQERDKKQPHFNTGSFESSRTSSGQDEDVAPDAAVTTKQGQAPRRFAPILIDTARRTRKADQSKAITFADKTEEGFGVHAREHRHHIKSKKSRGSSSSALEESDNEDSKIGDAQRQRNASHSMDPTSKIRREIEALEHGVRPSSRFVERSHSFRLPELDTIDSSESEPGSQSTSLSSSPGQDSPIVTSSTSYTEFKHATRIRESIDEGVSDYLRKLEAKRAEEKMRDQVLAAFPNTTFHEPVHHYVNEEQENDSDDSLEDRPATWEGHEDEILAKHQRESTQVPYEQLEMQKHAEQVEQERRANRIIGRQVTQGPWWVPGSVAEYQQNADMTAPGGGIRPPMLGNDLRFPRCRSPEPARFDVTQGSTALRNQMCYLSEQSASEANKADAEPALWQGKPSPKPNFTSMKTPSTSIHDASARSPGLWGGFCHGTVESTNTGLAPPTQPTGLMTPRFETKVNPFEHSFAIPPHIAMAIHPGISTPQTPPQLLTPGAVNTLDALLVYEKELDDVMSRDYPNTFITQVYNYLSLGYPSLARAFDAELSKISRISIAELRQDDVKAREQPRGYIRLGDDFEGGGEEVKEEGCVRWQALKSYIREWARQEKDMVSSESNWGTAARRGSWGN
nr:hypothetical protein B0A51_04519 [Rachicladosporium sp. CCFEE 5018]